MNKEFAACRDLRHAWTPRTATRAEGGFERQLQCLRCGTIKIQKLDSRGYLRGTKFTYPPDYVRPRGSGRVTQEENASMRLFNLKRRKR